MRQPIRRAAAAIPLALLLAACAEDPTANTSKDVQTGTASTATCSVTGAPPDGAKAGYVFSKTTVPANAIDAGRAMQAAESTGLISEAFTAHLPATCSLVAYTRLQANGDESAPARPVWVVAVANVPHFNRSYEQLTAAPTQFKETAEWIIDAVTGEYITAAIFPAIS